MRKTLLSMVASSLALAASVPAEAALIADLAFVQQTGTVLSNQPIDVYLRLTLDPLSDALTTDASGTPTSGFDFGGYTGPVDLNDPSTRVVLNNFFECSGNFGSSCTGGPPYDFEFNYAAPSFIGIANLNLQPGESYEWLFGTFAPTGGNAPAGTYSFFNAGAIIQIYNPGADLLDPNDDLYDSVTIAQTCVGQNPDCAFTREVIAASGAVPEPASWAMMIAGFGLVGAALRRRANVSIEFS